MYADCAYRALCSCSWQSAASGDLDALVALWEVHTRAASETPEKPTLWGHLREDRHKVPVALLERVVEVAKGNGPIPVVLEHTDDSGNVIRAYPIIQDGRVVRIDFSVNEHED